jgi:hypothetical protein
MLLKSQWPHHPLICGLFDKQAAFIGSASTPLDIQSINFGPFSVDCLFSLSIILEHVCQMTTPSPTQSLQKFI